MTKWLIVAVSFFSSLLAFGQANDINFDRVTIEDGISQNTIVSISQDEKGFLWIGTQDGLNRYDGYEFRVFLKEAGNDRSLSHNRTSTLTYLDSDSLVVGTIDGLNIFNTQTEQFTQLGTQDRLSSSLVNSVATDNDNNLWIGTNNGLTYLSKNGHTSHFKSENNKQSLSHNNINCLLLENDSTLWVGTNNGLSKGTIKEDHTIEFQQFAKSALSSAYITALYKDKRGIIWVGTTNGINRYNASSDTFESFYPKEKRDFGLSGNYITCIQEDSQDNFWVGTKNGLDKLIHEQEDVKFIHYKNHPTDPNSLSNNWVTAIFEDQTNVLWVGTFFGGLNKLNLNKKPFNLYQHDPDNSNSLSSSIIRGMVEDHNKNIWIATVDGLNKIDRSNNETTRYYHEENNPNSLSFNYAKSLLIDREGTMWIGTGEDGINLYDFETEKFKQIPPRDSQNQNSYIGKDIWVIYEDSDGEIWLGTEQSGLNRYNPNTQEYIHYNESRNQISSDKVYAIDQDKKGNIWIGTWGGLDVYNKATNQWKHFQTDENDPKSLSENYIKDILVDKNDQVWTATAGGGICKLIDQEKGIFKTYSKKDGLSNNFTYGILEDSEGFLWISTNYGLSKFDPKTETFKTYDQSEGLQGNEFNTGAFYKSKSGEMFFGGLNGVTYFYPDSIQYNPYPPKIIISDMKIYNQPLRAGDSTYLNEVLKKDIAYTEKLEMSYKNKVISFEYAGLHFVNPKKNRYAYKLEGFDTTWTYTNANKRFATYTNLPHGEYTFKVKAANNDGFWSESPAQLSLIITPPFWQTWWFKAIALITIIGGAISIHRYRVYSINEQKKSLEKEVKARTKEIKEQNNEILTANEELAQKQDEIMAQNEALEERGRELEKSYKNIRVISDIGHEISSLLDFNTIIEKVYEHINNLMDANEFSIGIYNEEQEVLSFAPYIYNSQKYDGYTVSIHDSRLTCWSVINKKPIWIGDFEKEYKKYIPNLEKYDDNRDILLKSVICIPLLVEGRRIGMVCVQSPKVNAYEQYHFDMLNALSAYIAVGLDNSNAYHDLESKVQARTEDLNKAYSKLIDTNRQFDEFTYRSAHDLRGPLARLLGLCYLGKLEVANEPGKGLEFLQLLEKAAFEMDHLLGRLLRTHENKKRVVTKSQIDIKKTIDKALSTIKKTEELDKFTFNIDVNPGLKLETDEFLFEVLLENLILNAVHFYDREKPHHEITVSAINENGYVKIAVKDNGLGIPRDQHQRIFDMFFIGSEVSKGSGLGLYESKMIVERLGGNIRLLRSDNELTVFEISLN